MTTTSVTQPEIVQQFFNESHFEGTVEDLLSALEGPQKSPLPIATQAEVFVLLWALDGYLKILREHIHEGKYIRIYNLAQSALLDLCGEIPLTDKGMAAANKKVDALPEGNARRKAIAYKDERHSEYNRRHGLSK